MLATGEKAAVVCAEVGLLTLEWHVACEHNVPHTRARIFLKWLASDNRMQNVKTNPQISGKAFVRTL